MIPMTTTRIAATALLLLPLGPVRAEPLAGFDAFTAWDQRLPGLLEFVALEFPAPLPGDAHPGLNLVAADGGTTLRAREHIRFNGLISLFGDFRFEAPAINLGSATILAPGSWLSFDTSGAPAAPFEQSSEVRAGATLGLGGHPILPTVGIPEPIILQSRPGGLELSSLDPRTQIQVLELEGPFLRHDPTIQLYAIAVEITDPYADLDPVPLPATAPLLSAALGLFVLRVRRR
jgi:hypothetical protein